MMGVWDDYAPRYGASRPEEGWQTVEITDVREDETSSGNPRLTISVRCGNGAAVKYAHSVIMGFEWSNRTLTELLLAFHKRPEAVRDSRALKGARGEAYLWKVENYDGKAFWKIRNMKIPAYEGNPAYETYYKKAARASGKPSGEAAPASWRDKDSFDDDIPF